jgi:hypothetical protein
MVWSYVMQIAFFHPGSTYDLPKKMEVAEIYIEMCWTMFPIQPSHERVGAKARVSPHFSIIESKSYNSPHQKIVCFINPPHLIIVVAYSFWLRYVSPPAHTLSILFNKKW